MEKENILNLRCYAYGKGNSWEAICVDFDIATFGASLNEVKASLTTSIELYLEEVQKLPTNEQQIFLNRKSPRHVRFKLLLISWLNYLRIGSTSEEFMLQSQIPVFS